MFTAVLRAYELPGLIEVKEKFEIVEKAGNGIIAQEWKICDNWGFKSNRPITKTVWKMSNGLMGSLGFMPSRLVVDTIKVLALFEELTI